MSARRRAAALVAGIAIVLGAATAASASSVTPSATASRTAWKGFPQQLVTDLGTGRPFDLGSLAKAGRPVLVWFWAPT